MPRFRHDKLDFAYFDEGEPSGDPVLLIHGFASNKTVNWIGPGWVKTLGGAGYRVIAIDNRGHGESDKPHETEAYVPEKMAADAIALLDHLEIGKAHVMGYSMGARIGAFMSLAAPEGSVPSYSAASESAWFTGLVDGRASLKPCSHRRSTR